MQIPYIHTCIHLFAKNTTNPKSPLRLSLAATNTKQTAVCSQAATCPSSLPMSESLSSSAASASSFTRPDAKTALKVVVIVHITFERSLLTPQKLAFFYHMNIADRFSPKKGGVCVFRSENTTPRITSARRTLDKQAKQTTDTTLHHNFAI